LAPQLAINLFELTLPSSPHTKEDARQILRRQFSWVMPIDDAIPNFPLLEVFSDAQVAQLQPGFCSA
jgi:hypothetical protein